MSEPVPTSSAPGQEGSSGPAAAAETEAAILRRGSEAALAYVDGVADRVAGVGPDALAGLTRFHEDLPDGPGSAIETLDLLAEVGGPATMASAGTDYFGFVNGGTLPVALGTAFLTSAWDQNAALPVMSPVAAELYGVARGWLLDLLGLPTTTDLTFVTGATMANASCLAAARDALSARLGWDVPSRGLNGAPPIEVVVGAQAHSTIGKSLSLTGLGRDRVTVVPSDDQGRIIPAGLDALDLPDDRPVIVCAQAGEVNTGAFDPFEDLVAWCRSRNGPAGPAWLHVDGAFGLWALADPGRADLVRGLVDADSWATDGHKWLNVTYDCGLAMVAHPGALRRTFTATAGYLPTAFDPDAPFESPFELMHHTPQSSQRARQVEVWAVLRTLGRQGVADLIRRAGDSARLIADHLAGAGFELLNDVVLNQVLVRWGDGASTEALIEAIQADGRVWCGPTQWQGETAMRVSVSSWRTTPDTARQAAEVMVELAERIGR